MPRLTLSLLLLALALPLAAQPTALRSKVPGYVDSLAYDVRVPCTLADSLADLRIPDPSRRACSGGRKTDTRKVVPLYAKADFNVASSAPSKVLVNYWLFTQPGDTQVFRDEAALLEGCKPVVDSISVGYAMEVLRDDARRDATQALAAVQALDKTDARCILFAAASKVRDTPFYVTLRNREAFTWRYFAFDFRPTLFTIPLKAYLPTGEAPLRGTANVNGNAMFQPLKYGRAKYYYERGTSSSVYVQHQFGLGVFGGLSVTEIKADVALNRQAAGDTLTVSRLAPTASLGFGLVYAQESISLGVFVGRDYAFGDKRDYWDYQGKTWLGFGLSVSSLLARL